MLTVLLGKDWTQNRNRILEMIAEDASNKKDNRILIVPELISHDTERRLCEAVGNAASRYAEVLSFSRMYRRVCESMGHGVEECLDNGGRIVAMAAAARRLHSKLKTFAAIETKPEFLSDVVNAVDEFKRCCISSGDLMNASHMTTGTLAQKLEELALLMDTYDSLCLHGKRDPSDEMTWLLEQLEDSSFAQSHVFYIDGFPDFTLQHMAIIEFLVQNSAKVVIGFNCDCLDSDNPSFEKAGETAGALIRFAKRYSVPYEIHTVADREDALKPVRERLFQGLISQTDQLRSVLQVQQFSSVHDEILAVIERIRNLVYSGARYRDIGVVCSDISVYQNLFDMAFERNQIPMYRTGTEDILDKTVMVTVLSAIDAALGGFERKDVIRYAKSTLSPVDFETCNLLENYCIMWNIFGSRWSNNWTYHPDGLDGQWDEISYNRLNMLNRARKEIIEPLYYLYHGFKEATSVTQQVICLYHFFEKIGLSSRLSQLADDQESAGDLRGAQILNQLWDILITALEQMYDVLGSTAWDAETFVRLLRLLLSQYDVGTIPPVLDAVMVGTVSAMRCHQFKHIIVVGVLEGAMPGYAGATGVLNDNERSQIRNLGVPLAGGSMDGVRAEFSEIYGVFCGAQESICVFCPSGQPSYLFRRLADSVGESRKTDVSLTNAKANSWEASAYLSRYGAADYADDLQILDIYRQVEVKKEYTFGTVSEENIKGLYGNSLNLSASQVDKQADCRLSYYLKYGVRAKERKTITIDPAEFGTYVHAVLEKTASDVMDRGGFHVVSFDDTLQIADVHARNYIQERFSQLDTSRVAYLFNRNTEELKLIVRELWNELSTSEFEPKGFEVAFGDAAQIEAIPIPGRKLDAQLRGFVDRVDVWEQNGNQYFRVVDYKTGRKDFDYCDVFNGYGLQMLLYMFALQDAREKLIGENPIPAGVQYFPARIPVVAAEGSLTEQEADALREKALKRKGLLLHDEDVLYAMEPTDKPHKLNYTKKKDGTLGGDLATSEQMGLLKGYVFLLLGNLVDDIASGCVDPNPYTRGSSHNACTFCPYCAVCHPVYVEGRRNYRAMKQQHFWEEIEKEMRSNG